ncbi:MAG: hypothetical protein ACI4SE_05745 [Lachnospiraceae bacterium]
MLTIKDICEVSELEEIVHANCPEHESWNMILRIEKQMHEGGVLAQRLMNEKKECVGIMQYYYHEGSLLQKPEIEISLLTLFQNPVEYVQELHKMFLEQYPAAKKLIQVLEKEDFGSPIERYMLKTGFKKYENEGQPKYGYTSNSAYYVLKCDREPVRPKSRYEL